jgi:hypothetical protein
MRQVLVAHSDTKAIPNPRTPQQAVVLLHQGWSLEGREEFPESFLIGWVSIRTISILRLTL